MKIKLLDNKEYNKQELIKRMYDDNFYYGDLNKLALSSSSLKLLIDSPKKYHYIQMYGQKESQGLRDGTLLHTLILEPEKWDQFVFVDVASKNSKAYREAKMEHGVVYTRKEKQDAERVADALLKNEGALKLLTDCDYEVPTIGEVFGYPFRAKADVLGAGRITDIKTCSDIKAFPYSAKKYGYDVQCFLYCSLFGIDYQDFKFLVIDKGSLDVGLWEVSEEFYNEGMEKVKYGISVYQDFFTNDEEIDLNNYIIKGTL